VTRPDEPVPPIPEPGTAAALIGSGLAGYFRAEEEEHVELAGRSFRARGALVSGEFARALSLRTRDPGTEKSAKGVSKRRLLMTTNLRRWLFVPATLWR